MPNKHITDSINKLKRIMEGRVNHITQDPDDPRVGIYSKRIIEDLFRHELESMYTKGREAERKEWESRGIITDCHNCDKVVHIFPGDAARLMKEYYGGLDQITNNEQ